MSSTSQVTTFSDLVTDVQNRVRVMYARAISTLAAVAVVA